MKKYHIEVINSNKQQYRIIEADSVSWSDAGLYEFIKFDNGIRIPVAYYPVNRTIITKIENEQ